jgi:hypothetical protein
MKRPDETDGTWQAGVSVHGLRILVVADLDTDRPYGQSVRPWRLSRAMAEQGLEIAVVGVHTAGIDFGPTWEVERRSLRGFYRVTREAEGAFGPDVVYAHQNLPAVGALLAAQVPVVADFHALPSLEWRQLSATVGGGSRRGALVKSLIAQRAERFIAGRADGVIAAGDEVAADLARIHRRGDAHVVPNGIGDELLDRKTTTSSPPWNDAKPAAAHVVAILPTAASAQNAQALAFLSRVAEAVEASDTRVVFHVLGTDAGPGPASVRYEGFVADLAPWLRFADACLLPFDARARLFGGARNKLLEYLAAARRIVSTREGFRGLAQAMSLPGVYICEESPSDFARGVVSACDAGPELESAGRSLLEGFRWSRMAVGAAEALEAHVRQ